MEIKFKAMVEFFDAYFEESYEMPCDVTAEIEYDEEDTQAGISASFPVASIVRVHPPYGGVINDIYHEHRANRAIDRATISKIEAEAIERWETATYHMEEV